jgi:RHS repeat-associated protein
VVNGDRFNYVYNYTDHLGNIRVSYGLDPESNVLKILEENHYYPFGLKHKNYGVDMRTYQQNNLGQIRLPLVSEVSYKYRYNSKEYQDELGLNWYDYQARNYDPALGRWMNIDPLAEMSRRFSPYTYCYDNPLVFVDYDGMFATPPLDYYNQDGRKIGTDGVNDGSKAVVKDSDQVKAIKKTDKSGGTTALSAVSSAVVLPSDKALNESLDVLDRTVKNGGKSEETSLVMNDGLIIRGEKGPEAQYDKEDFASATLPNLPEGKTPADVEVTIHSHLTHAEVVDGKVIAGNATIPTTGENGDLPTFGQYKTNIIVGPLGQATATQGISSSTGKMETIVNSAPLGISIYSGSNPKPVLDLSKKAVERILNK